MKVARDPNHCHFVFNHAKKKKNYDVSYIHIGFLEAIDVYQLKIGSSTSFSRYPFKS
jgi:hypothetical protein